VLEASFGTGWLLTQYASRFEAHGIDLNEQMLRIANRNLRRKGLTAQLRIANVERIPYPDDTFDTVLNTLAFSGYPTPTRPCASYAECSNPKASWSSSTPTTHTTTTR
jgi:ubiquinone/menaquinone biosynthesis C-methylase UbiE